MTSSRINVRNEKNAAKQTTGDLMKELLTMRRQLRQDLTMATGLMEELLDELGLLDADTGVHHAQQVACKLAGLIEDMQNKADA